jgi:phospholipase C
MTKHTRRPGLTRRTVLGNAVKGMGAAMLAPVVKGCATDGVPPEDPATIGDRIDTVVVVMMENRSFDHMFGALSLVEGRSDVDGFLASMTNARTDGTIIEPHPADLACILDPPHGWSSSHRQFAEGANSGFVTEHEARHGVDEAARVMGYWGRDKLPASYGMLEGGALAQQWYASVMGPTWPNRYYSLLGTSMGNESNDPIPDELPTIFERVFRSGRTYANYYGNIPFAALCARVTIEDPEYMKMEQFYDDASAGRLANLVWIDPVYGRNDDHPPAHPLAGQVFLQSVYQALATSPQWERSMLIVTYDEHGGFYDHVPPPKVVDERASLGFDQLGFRVPSQIVGPWVKQGHVSDTVYDHTSIMKTLCTLWDLEPRTERDANIADVLDVIDMERIESGNPAAPVTLAPIEASDDELYAPACRAELPFSLGMGHFGITGQPELEAYVRARFPNSTKDLSKDTDRVYEDQLAIARDLGVLVSKKS